MKTKIEIQRLFNRHYSELKLVKKKHNGNMGYCMDDPKFTELLGSVTSLRTVLEYYNDDLIKI